MNFLDDYIPLGIDKQTVYRDVFACIYSNMDMIADRDFGIYVYRPTLRTLAGMFWNKYKI